MDKVEITEEGTQSSPSSRLKIPSSSAAEANAIASNGSSKLTRATLVAAGIRVVVLDRAVDGKKKSLSIEKQRTIKHFFG